MTAENLKAYLWGTFYPLLDRGISTREWKKMEATDFFGKRVSKLYGRGSTLIAEGKYMTREECDATVKRALRVKI